MSKAAGIIGKIAAVVALVAGIALLFVPGGQVFGIALIKIAAVASAVSAVAMAASQALMKPPDSIGSVSQILIGKNLPVPYAIGRTLIGGLQVYDKSGNGPNNFDRTMIQVLTAGGPIEEFQTFQMDYSTIGFVGSDWNVSRVASGYYGADGGYLWLNSRKGLTAETALTPFAGRSAFTEWGAAHKLSGFAAYAITMEFDEDGKRWGAGIPQPGVIAKWVKVYDPRLDSTYPGGAGTQRWATESTWAWSENPALHALTYLRGRFHNGIRVVGCGMPQESLRLSHFVELANLCDANAWKVGGLILDGPGMNRWEALKRILEAAAAEPVWAGGMLGLSYSSPKTSVFTIVGDSLADGDIEIRAMQGWRDRINTIVPKVRLETHKWEYEQLSAVTSATYVTEDRGEIKTREIQFDLVQQITQGSQLAGYKLVNGREFGPITLSVKPEYMVYRPGEAGTLVLPELGLASQLVVIKSTSVDPGTGVVQLVLESETNAKHAFALGLTGTAPATPTIVGPDVIDAAVADLTGPASMSLAPSADGFLFIDGIPADPLQTITVTAVQNPASAITWSVSPAVTLGAPSATSRTLTLANFGTNQMVTVTAVAANGLVSSLVIPRIDITTPSDSIIPDSNFNVAIGSVATPKTWIGSGAFTRFTVSV